MKTVHVTGHSFDCMPAHVTVAGKGSGANVRVATQRAVGEMLCDQRLYKKHINDFKISVVVISDRKVGSS